MGIMSAVRSQVPVPAMQPITGTATERAAMGQSVAAVAQPQHPEALRQPDSAAAAIGVQLAERDEDHDPVAAARIAAEAARDAYIRASVAAGVNPLPLP